MKHDGRDAAKAARVMEILSGVMSEESHDKDSSAYAALRELDKCLRDRLGPALNKFGLGEGPEAMQMSDRLIRCAETACRFPELLKQNLVRLEVPFVNVAFSEGASGLIDPIPEICGVRTVCPVLALHGSALQIEYVNYADNRRTMTLQDYAFLNEWAYVLTGLQLRRLIKNFIIVAPQVTEACAVLIVPSGGRDAWDRGGHVKRFNLFVGKSLDARQLSASGTLPFIVRKSAYLGLREQMDGINVLVRGGLWRDEYAARTVSKRVTEDLVRRDGGNEGERVFFGRFRDEAKAKVDVVQGQLNELNPILNSAVKIVERLRRETYDYYDGRKRRLPRHVQTLLCRIVEEYTKTGQHPAEFLGRLKTYGVDVESAPVTSALERGNAARNAHRVDADALFEDGEEQLRRCTAMGAVLPTDERLVPFKRAAAFGNTKALARLAEIFYETGRYARDRILVGADEIDDARTLKFIIQKLVEKGWDTAKNTWRLYHLRICLGELAPRAASRSIVSSSARPTRSAAASVASPFPLSWEDATDASRQDASADGNDEDQSEYDENADYRSSERLVSTSSSDCCFVTTAALKSLSASRFEMARAFVLMKRLRDVRLTNSAEGRVLLSTYYRVAPGIVGAIDARTDQAECYAALWRRYIQPCCRLVREGRLEAAERLYSDMVQSLLFLPIEQVVGECVQNTSL